jgi:pyruvate ferredoxin oxidoreductase alpha subunit
MKRLALTGNEAMAYAIKQARPQVFVGYPITPASDILSLVGKYVANGEIDCEFVTAESEHSVASVLFGAAAAGARAFTCTASQGLALMHEVLHIISGARLPIIIASSSRSLSSPINVHGDHQDFLDMRDASFIQIFSENSQDSYDNLLQAIRVAEKVNLPAIVSNDGFITSHNLEPVKVISDKDAFDFVGEYQPAYSVLDIENPVTVNPLSLPDSFMEIKKSQADAMIEAKKEIINVANDFQEISGREYGFYRGYKLEDAEIALIVMGSTAETGQIVIDELRKKKIKVGLLSLRVFRPFPAIEIAQALAHCKAICVMDRAEGFRAQGGPLFMETTSALFLADLKIKTFSRIYGLGGREIDEMMIRDVFEDLIKINKGEKIKLFAYVGLKK